MRTRHLAAALGLAAALPLLSAYRRWCFLQIGVHIDVTAGRGPDRTWQVTG